MRRRPDLARRLTAALLLAGAGAAGAQTVYRSVGPDGRVSFSDRPPSAVATPAPQAPPTASAGTGPALPYALQQVVARFPVVLYASDDCAPCDQARAALTARGIPFQERSVRSDADVEALRQLTGDNALPVATIGAQRLKGYAPSEWSAYLDSAGYPASSQLPSGYRPRPAQALVSERVPPAAPTQSAPASPPPAPARPAPANPAGFVF
jgi:glutaredoxin